MTSHLILDILLSQTLFLECVQKQNSHCSQVLGRGGGVKQPQSHTKGTLIEEKRLVLYSKSDFMKFRPGAKYSLASFLGHIFLGHLCVQ